MSIAVSLDTIPPELRKEIVKLNTYKPDEKHNNENKYAETKDKSFTSFRTITLNGQKVTLLPSNFAKDYVKTHPEIMMVENEFHRLDCSYKFTGQLRHYQEAAKDRAIEHLEEFGTSTLSLHAGAGKTVTSAAIFANYRGVLAIVIHLETLIVQWVETFNNFTDAKVHVYGNKKNKYSIEEANVWIIMEKRIINLVEEGISDWVRMVVVDEAHHFCTKTRCQAILGFRPDYLLMVTATPRKENGLHTVMESFVGTHSIYRAYEVTFKVKRILTGVVPTREFMANGTLNYTTFSQSLMYNYVRNIYVSNLVEINRGRKILILTKEKKHVDILRDMISTRKISVATMRGNDKEYTDAEVLIGTVSKIGCGFDEATFANCYNGKRIDLLIFLASYKNVATIEQSVGRVLRSENPEIIYLCDQDSVCDSHWRVFRDWSISNNGTCFSYKTDLESNFENLKRFHYGPSAKIKIIRNDVRLWLPSWGEEPVIYKERIRSKKGKRMVNATQHKV